jgi:hypothetical protein
MTDNFAQTVNLREKMERERAAMLARTAGTEHAPDSPAPEPAKRPKPAPARKPEKTVAHKPEKNKAEGIDEIYGDSGHERHEDLKKISRPAIKRVNERLYRRIVIAMGLIIVLSVAYWLVFRHAGAGNPAPATSSEPKWYMVELTSGETYYGQISDKSANPVVLTTVYYNYDQLNPGEAKPSDNSGNLKLVKRGQETAGPSGTMYIYQVQIKKIDELRPDSKVLKAILDNENK